MMGEAQLLMMLLLLVFFLVTSKRELEKNVERLKRDPTSGTTSRPITLKDVEEGAVNLRKVGEALAGLKGDCESGLALTFELTLAFSQMADRRA